MLLMPEQLKSTARRITAYGVADHTIQNNASLFESFEPTMATSTSAYGDLPSSGPMANRRWTFHKPGDGLSGLLNPWSHHAPFTRRLNRCVQPASCKTSAGACTRSRCDQGNANGLARKAPETVAPTVKARFGTPDVRNHASSAVFNSQLLRPTLPSIAGAAEPPLFANTSLLTGKAGLIQH